MENLLELFRQKFRIGEYPPEYNPKIHGPYYPSRYYGKADIKFTQVKLGELRAWLSRRSYHPLDMISCVTRGSWRWRMKWLLTKKASLAPFIQVAMLYSLFGYVNQYPRYRIMGHHHTKYHW